MSSEPPLAAKGPMPCPLTGRQLLNSTYYNKGAAFTNEERETFSLVGLLPAGVHTLEQQCERAYGQYSSRSDDMAKNTFLQSMADQNTVLYFKLIESHIKEMYSILYTPTEGEAIASYSKIFRRPNGCFLNIHEQDRCEEILKQWGTEEEIDYIVVSDGEEILGIGDQGVGAIGISQAKLVLMTLCGGLHPNRTLPVVLDCGTDNEDLLADELYLGLKHKRVRGRKYDEFVEKFVQAVRKLFPKAVLHFEDFGLQNARRFLEKYRPQIPCFNDDVQGTGVVTIAAIEAAAWIAKTELKDLRILIYGAGSAGAGIADQFEETVVSRGDKSKEDAMKQIWLIDKPGLLVKSLGDKLTSAQKTYARSDDDWEKKDTKDLVSVIREVKPHVLIGCSTRPGAFTEKAVREMAKHIERPIIFPLSNPTRLHEAQPQDLFKWTDGKALVATGSPFDPIKHAGKEYIIAECNNATAFPGVGLGAVLCRADRISDNMLAEAVIALAKQSPALQQETMGLLPDIVDVRSVSKKIACKVIRAAQKEGLSRVDGIPEGEDELVHWVEVQMWEPKYRDLKKAGSAPSDKKAKEE